MEATSLCALGHHGVNPVLSTLRYFRDEYAAHVHDEKRCPAGVCKALITLQHRRRGVHRLRPVRAAGAPRTPSAGEKKQPHTIDPELCIKCGICRDVCRFDAVLVQ